MPTLYGRNYQLKELQALWAPLYESVYNIFGTTTIILPMGDPHHGQPNGTTFTTVGDEQLTFTWSKAPSTFDTPLDLTLSSSFQGIIPFVDFDGTDEEADTPDAGWATWIATAPFIMGLWVNLDVAASMTLMSKWDLSTGAEDREWFLGTDASGYPYLNIYDESNNAAIGRRDETALPTGQCCLLVARYDGGTDAANIDILLNGVETDDANTLDDAGFASMVDGATVVALGYYEAAGGTKAGFINGRIAGGPLGPFFVDADVTDDAIRRYYNLGRKALGL